MLLVCEVPLLKYPADSKASLYPFPRGSLRNTSQVDTASVDHQRFPGFHKADYQEIVIDSGEVLYMPPKMWHEVESLSGSLSLSYWWI